MSNPDLASGSNDADPLTPPPAPVASTPDASAPDAGADADPAAPAPQQLFFADLDLPSDIQAALDDMGYLNPTPVQAAVYAPVLAGKDLMVQSRTGTGKTTAFGLPIMAAVDASLRAPQAIVLTPTRELALQVCRELAQLGKHKALSIVPIYGGAPITKQITQLKDGVHIVVGTPGRVLDHISRRTLDLKQIRFFVLDECDEMLSMGFLEDIDRIASHTPKTKQTLLFSATMPNEVVRYSKRQMREPEQIALSSGNISVAEIHHGYYIVSGIARARDLMRVIVSEQPDSAIIFCNTRDETGMVARFLQKQGLDAEPLSSDLSQADRERVMKRMRDKNLKYLVATDVAARGIDITELSHVINYSFPDSAEVYVHRTGRTGRAGKKGTALSLIGPRELSAFWYLKVLYKLKPEERDLPPASILDGVLKTPLPRVGAPPPPDPLLTLRGLVTGEPTEEYVELTQRLLAEPDGAAVVALLIGSQLDAIKAEKAAVRAAAEAARLEREARAREERGGDDDRFGDRPRFGGRDRDGERPRFGGRDRDGERPRFGGRDRDGERPRFGGRDRDERPRFERDRAPEERTEPTAAVPVAVAPELDETREERRPRRFEREPRVDREARPEREPRADREARPEREPRADREPRAEREPRADREPRDARPEREPFRDREPRAERAPRDADREPRDARPEREPFRDREPRAERAPRDADREPRDARPERAPRDADREPRDVRPERAPRDADREPRDVRPERAPRDADRASRDARPEREPRRGDDRKPRNGASAEPVDQRDFWETWADEKSARVPEVKAEPAPRAEREPRTEREPRAERPSEERGRGRGRRSERAEAAPAAEQVEAPAPRAARAPRADKATTPAPAAPADPGAQVRIHVNLGKKNGMAAADIRTFLGEAAGVEPSTLGSVAMRDTYCHVRVPSAVAERIIAAVSGQTHGDTVIKIELAHA